MSPSNETSFASDLARRFVAFVAERHPLAAALAERAMGSALDDTLDGNAVERSPEAIEALAPKLREELEKRLVREARAVARAAPEELVPGVDARERLDAVRRALVDDCAGFLRREAIAASLTADEKAEMLDGMILTRAVDNRLKTFFSGGEVRYGQRSFQGKGFRSLGQEAIYAAALRLRRGDAWSENGTWRGDVVAPMIRDLGAALAMAPDAEMVRGVLSAQMGKAGPPMNGRDLHIGDLSRGVLPPAAPLAIASLMATGVAFAMAREPEAATGEGRVAVAFIGEGGTSLGEWHEAMNVCAVHRLPAVFCIENNQTALSTPLGDQSAARSFADKAAGYGVPGLVVDGNDPEAIAAAFAWAAERARAGRGPALLELLTMRMCGHAHHDDMLYLGREPEVGWELPEPSPGGYVDRELYAFWAARDPIARYAERLIGEGVVTAKDVEAMKAKATELVDSQAKEVIAAPWPDGGKVGEGVYRDGAPARRIEVLERRPAEDLEPFVGLPALDPGSPSDAKGKTFLEAVMLGVGDALRADERAFVYGEDCGGSYGNAFLLLRPLLEEFGDRIHNSPLTESGTLGVAIGAAIAGLRPIAEIQFNDFIATGFNQLVNSAAKIHYRWGASVPMVVRLPWGGLRNAGPYHSQNTEPWFYRTPGLKIVTPSTPEDARALLLAAVADPDPVLYYEHIALYRNPKIKQKLSNEAPEPLPLGRAALRRAGSDLAIVSYGAFVHRGMEVAERLAEDGIEASVLDLRSLVPLDHDALSRVARHCGKVLILVEDTRRGSIGESLAATLQEELFEYLDAPVRLVASLDTPVPYAPSLEDVFLPSLDEIERAARLLAAY